MVFGSVSILALVLASSSPANADRAYAAWVVELAQDIGSSHDAGKLAMSAALHQHACAGRSADCFPTAQWHAMEEEAERGARPLPPTRCRTEPAQRCIPESVSRSY